MNEEFDHAAKPADAAVRELFDWLESGMTALVCAVLIFTFIGRIVGVVGPSMIPTLHDQDRLVAMNLFRKPVTGDIVVVTKPNDRNEPLIKRVIATGGQTLDIDFEQSAVYVDGELLDEPYINEPMDPRHRADLEFPLTVPEGYVFVMGDNRNKSWDSRMDSVGLIDERYVLGRIVYRVMPYKDMGVPK